MTPLELYNKTLPLANWFGKKYSGYLNKAGSLTIDDLRSAARIGLWNACQNFDEKRDVNITRFASICIKNAIQIELAKHMDTIRLPYKMKLAQQAFDKLEDEFHSEDGMLEAGLTEYQIKNLPLFNAAKTESLEDVGEMVDELDEESRIMLVRLELLNELLDKLDPKQKEVLVIFFGIDGKKEKVYEYIERKGISADTFRKLRAAGLARIKELMEQWT